METITIGLNLKFDNPTSVYSTGLGPCSFYIKIHNPDWEIVPAVYNCPASASSIYAGSNDFSLTVEITPINQSPVITYPFELSLTAYSTSFGNYNLISQPYSFSINSSNYESLTITNANLNNVTSQDGSFSYFMSTTFYFITDHAFNVTSSCSPPFDVRLISNSWNLSYLDCQVILRHTLLPGRIKYSISYQLMTQNGQLSNYTVPLPSDLFLQVSLKQINLMSNIYDLTT